jgi:hypothetical protein
LSSTNLKLETGADGAPPYDADVKAVTLSACSLLATTAVLALSAGPASAYWMPPPAPTFYWQLQGRLDMAVPAAVYDVDGFETSAGEVAALHAQGKHVVCYVDVGTAESFRPDYGLFPKSVLGSSNGWPGEKWLDIRRLSVLEPIMTSRFQMCREKGFDAIEPDNIEAFSNRSGFPITAAEQLTYDEWVAQQSHSLGLAVLQKNDGEQSTEQQPYFDGALTEQCNQYAECADFKPYLAAGKPVINVEYRLKDARFCAADEALGIVGARFNLALNGKRFEPCR